MFGAEVASWREEQWSKKAAKSKRPSAYKKKPKAAGAAQSSKHWTSDQMNILNAWWKSHTSSGTADETLVNPAEKQVNTRNLLRVSAFTCMFFSFSRLMSKLWVFSESL